MSGQRSEESHAEGYTPVYNRGEQPYDYGNWGTPLRNDHEHESVGRDAADDTGEEQRHSTDSAMRQSPGRRDSPVPQGGQPRYAPNPPAAPEAAQTLNIVQDLLRHMVRQQEVQQEQQRETPSAKFTKLVKMMKDLGILKFKGKVDTMLADKWMRRLEMTFEVSRCPREFRKEIAVHFLEDDARSWWESVSTRYRYQHVTWEDFKREFERKFFPPEARDRLERQFMRLEQGSLSVREYEQEFLRLRRYLYSGHDDEATMVRRFLAGLRPEIAGRLQAVTYPHVIELAERAVNVEEGMEREKGTLRREVPLSSGSKSEKRKEKVTPRKETQAGRSTGNAGTGERRPTPRATQVCYRCGNTGHIAKYCSSAPRENPASAEVICYYCGEKGHFANQCPKRVQVRGTQGYQQAPARATEGPPAKRQATSGRVYALDVENLPEPPRPPTGPITGTFGF